ncbi:MAG: hypothetical protein KGD64_06455 [Candidatus Heimdallarchaeota archaeon]|nr:hypothetical protein [Candidatus Heimdallarchaeota archaeon]
MRTRALASIWFLMFFLGVLPLIISLWSIYLPIYMKVLGLLLPSIGIVIGIINVFRAENQEKRDFVITIATTLTMLLLYQIFENLFSEGSNTIHFNYWSFFYIAAYFSFLGISIKRIIIDYKYITKSSFFIGIALVSFSTVVVSPILSYFYNVLGQTFTSSEFVVLVIVLIVDFIAFAILAILLTLYLRLKYGYYWLFLAIGFAMMIFRDVSRIYSIILVGEFQPLTPDVLSFIFYSTMITGLIASYDPTFEVKTWRNIDMEREFYKQRYEEIEYLSKDLLTVTELWYHDIQNDLSVINNAMELYEETSTTNFLNMIKKRVGLMEERQKKFETPAHILDSLRIQPTDLHILDGIQRSFSGINLNLPSDPVYVKANKLLFPIVLNIVQNAFQQNSDSVQVTITVEEINNVVILKIIDNGIGVPDDLKKKIFLKNFQGNKGGTSGMGLYLAKLTLAKFGGSVSIEDNKPSGAVFIIELDRIDLKNK